MERVWFEKYLLLNGIFTILSYVRPIFQAYVNFGWVQTNPLVFWYQWEDLLTRVRLAMTVLWYLNKATGWGPRSIAFSCVISG